MGIVRDITVDQLTQAVNNIDTSTLAQDSTLQDVVTAISNISGGSDPVTNTTVNTLGKDATLQSIAAALLSISQNVKPDASDIPYDSNISVKGKIDDICTDLIQTKTYTASYTIGGNASGSITSDDFSASIPTGYAPIGISDFASQNVNVVVRGIYGRATGTSAMMTLRNISSSSITATAYITILYIKASFI